VAVEARKVVLPLTMRINIFGKGFFQKELGTIDTKNLPCEIPKGGSGAAFHRVNEVDPLTCPKCSGNMKIISVIEDEEIIKKILKHLGL
jgi:hypothetical protein